MVKRTRSTIFALVALLTASPAQTQAQAQSQTQAQAPLPLLYAEANLSEYGMSDAAQVLRGRVSVAYGDEGPSLGVYFLRDRARPSPAPDAPPTPPPVLPDGVPAAPEGLVRPEAIWVWNTSEILADDGARQDFLRFVEAHGFARVFLQLPLAAGARPHQGFVPFDPAVMGALVGDLSGVGARVYALDGDPSYAFTENHEGVFRTVDRIAAFNAEAPPDQRFHGVRYDVEPYLAPGFEGPRRQEILDGYVALVAGLSRRARASGLALGLDVPFWLDGPDEESGAPLEAAWEGARRTVLDHVLEHADDVAIMDYRTQAAGPDGSVAHARAELERAGATETGVLVAVETERLVDEDLFTFAGTGWVGLPAENGRWIVLAPRDGDGVRLWLVDGPEARGRLVDAVAAAGLDATALRHWPAGGASRVSADKQSFHGLGVEAMLRETAREAEALSAFPAFLGLAYHNYKSLRALLTERPRGWF